MRFFMENAIINNREAGFWVRVTAIWIDIFIVFIVVKLIIFVFHNANIYMPLELIFVLSFLTYSILFTGGKGSTDMERP